LWMITVHGSQGHRQKRTAIIVEFVSTASISMDRVQRVRAHATKGAFRTVATAVAEAEVGIRTAGDGRAEGATRLWINLRTLPATNPFSKLATREFRLFTSPLQKIARAHQRTPTNKMEVIQPYVVTPWEKRIPAKIDHETGMAIETANAIQGIRIATSDVFSALIG
jgi:hypothetical protein